MEFDQLVPRNTGIVEAEPHRVSEESGASHRYLAAQTLIRGITYELKRNPAFTRALLGRYFMAVDGMSLSGPTVFEQGGKDFFVSYRCLSDKSIGGFHEALNFTKRDDMREDNLLLETHELWTAPQFTHDGSVVYQKDVVGGESQTVTVDTAESAHALLCGLMEMSPRFGVWLFG